MEIREKIVILNESDEVLERRGIIDEVRKVEVEALVDTGAVMMLIPQDMKDHLGLEDKGKVIVALADERKIELARAGTVRVEIGGRAFSTDCLVGPPGCAVLVGHIILEALDLVLDPIKGEAIPRPESPFLPTIKMKSITTTRGGGLVVVAP
jgi:clan AA aspartic protease